MNILLMAQATNMSSDELLTHDRENAEQACRRGIYIFGVLLSSALCWISHEDRLLSHDLSSSFGLEQTLFISVDNRS